MKRPFEDGKNKNPNLEDSACFYIFSTTNCCKFETTYSTLPVYHLLAIHQCWSFKGSTPADS